MNGGGGGSSDVFLVSLVAQLLVEACSSGLTTPSILGHRPKTKHTRKKATERKRKHSRAGAAEVLVHVESEVACVGGAGADGDLHPHLQAIDRYITRHHHHMICRAHRATDKSRPKGPTHKLGG